MTLVSQVSPTQNADNVRNIENYNKLMNDMRGQSKSTNTSKSPPSNDNKTLEQIKSIKDKIQIGEKDLWSMCPILLYQLTSPKSCDELLSSEANHDQHIQYELAESDRTWGKNCVFFFSHSELLNFRPKRFFFRTLYELLVIT